MTPATPAFSSTHLTPPGLSDNRTLFFFVTVALLTGIILALQWLYRMISERIETRSLSRYHPLVTRNLIVVLLLCASLTANVPRAVQVMTWQSNSPVTRQAMSMMAWSAMLLWMPLFAIAWWLDWTRGRQFHHQLLRAPLPPPVLSDDYKQRRFQGTLTMVLVFVVAFAITFVRVSPDVSYHPRAAATASSR